MTVKSNGKRAPLDLTRLFERRRFVVIGGTGFLGKLWWAFLLSHYPMLERLYVVVRTKNGQSAEQRFWNEIAPSQVFDALRAEHGAGFEAFLRDKVTPVPGDVAQPFCGLPAPLRDELRGRVDAVVNVAGVVDFDPPLDEALEVNAFGVQNLVSLARDLGDVGLLHTSTCYVAGSRTGHIEEADPRLHPFPRAGELDVSHWDPDREIAECLDVVEQARHRAGDAFRQSRFWDEARKNLLERGEPARGEVFDREVHKVKRKFEEARLAEMGMERAQFWGFPNTYTYTKAIGEQIVASSGLPFTIVRPAVVESTNAYPFPGWNEGINTSAPLIYIVRQGGLQIPGSENYLDVIPCDMVAGGMVLSLAELLDGTARPVYQYGSSDSNPCTMRRFFELTGLYKRRHYQKTGKGGPLGSFLQAHFEGAMLGKEQFERIGPPALSRGAKKAAGVLQRAALGPAAAVLKPAAKALEGFANQQRRVGNVLGAFVPFTAQYDYVFRCDNTRAAFERITEEDKRRINWTPERIDWRDWFLNVHAPGLEKWVFPQIDERLKRPLKAPARHETLPALLDEMAERYDLAVALQRTEDDGLSRLTFREWRARSRACAARLQAAGVGPGDRVLLAATSHPSWPVAFFGIQLAGATAVPLDCGIDVESARRLFEHSTAKVFIADASVQRRLQRELAGAAWLDLLDATQPGLEAEPTSASSDDVAALIYTSGTTGSPKGVMLTHRNLTALIAALAPLFPLRKGDRVLSVLPLHHTFELTCGLLLPLSRGARVIYMDELSADRLERTLKTGRITAMVGVPALWEMLERRISAKVAEHGTFAAQAFNVAIELNRALGKNFGIDAGRLLFGPVHEGLGGQLRYLVSGGAALPERTHHVFAGLGLRLAEGYGLTEASPVLTVATAAPNVRAGHVGKPLPGMEVRIEQPNAEGVGEVLARGPNVMLGYAGDDAATRQVIDDAGWLHTGDLGKLDGRGNLVIVGRQKEVIVSSNGENVYPDDVEARLGRVEHVAEFSLVGVADGRGGERVACVAVPENAAELDRIARHTLARKALEKSFTKLPQHMRPTTVALVDAPLPRTATRKVKRSELRRIAERVQSVRPVAEPGMPLAHDGASRAVRAAVAVIARRPVSEVQETTNLRGDLGFDSLMLLELLVMLEAQLGRSLDAEKLADCSTIAEIEAVLRENGTRRLTGDSFAIESAAEKPLVVPPLLREATMHWLGRAQMSFYDTVLRTRVTGRAFIPHNRPTLVVANHASHLDMGLVKYALGPYGNGLTSLAAQDYFFEGSPLRKAYFENFTNLVPINRGTSLRQSLRQAGEVLEQGKTVLIFPEGTRSADGDVHEFKAAVGHLALHHDVDILPVYLGGTFAALPKGASVLRQRNVEARIGPPLQTQQLRRLTEGMTLAEASRAVARLAQRAVEALKRGDVLDLAQLASLGEAAPAARPATLAEVFKELETRFVAGSVDEPVSFYFALGQSERWTVKITKDTCEVVPGKVLNPADCVLKTSPDIFTRIVREAYTPSPAEFMSGTVKSNNIGLLFTFQKAFQLSGDN